MPESEGFPEANGELRPGLPPERSGPQAPERQPGGGLAIPFPGRTAERRPAGRAGPAAPPGRVRHSAVRKGGGEAVRPHEAGDASFVPARLRDALAGRRLRHPDGAGVARARGRGDDEGFPARPEPRRQRDAEPGGRPAGSGGGAQPIPTGIGDEPCRPFRPAVRSRGTGRDGTIKGSIETWPGRSTARGCERCGGRRKEVRGLNQKLGGPRRQLFQWGIKCTICSDQVRRL